MATRRKLAFINCRTYGGGSALINMPFALNIILKLQTEWMIDLYLGSKPNPEYRREFSHSVTIHQIDKLLVIPWRLKELALFLRCFKLGYRVVFGMGQVGTYIAYLLAKVNHCPLVIINDEFPSCFRHSRWTLLNARAHQGADIIIIPDKARIAGLCREISGIESKKFVELLNVPLPSDRALPKVDWRQRLSLPPGSIPLIFAGGIGDHNQIPELLGSVRFWPERYVLIIRGHNRAFARKYRNKVQHLDIPGRIFWLLEPLTTDEFTSLLQYCRISFALYRPDNANMIEMGKASGKILQSVSLGLPVIASDFPSLAYVRENGLGKLVAGAPEIPDAISAIMDDEDAIKESCRRFAGRCLDYEEGWRTFTGVFYQLLEENQPAATGRG